METNRDMRNPRQNGLQGARCPIACLGMVRGEIGLEGVPGLFPGDSRMFPSSGNWRAGKLMPVRAHHLGAGALHMG